MRSLVVAVILGVCLLFTAQASAVITDVHHFEGMFDKDNDVARVDFTMGATGKVTIFTSSWSSWTGGGFDPLVTIWNSNGTYFDADVNGFDGTTSCADANGNPELHAHGDQDTHFENPTMPLGDYFATITQNNNTRKSPASTFSDGFKYDTYDTFTTMWGPYSEFNGLDMKDTALRNGYWKLHIVGAQSATGPNPGGDVPEPSTLAIWSLLALCGFCWRWRRKKA